MHRVATDAFSFHWVQNEVCCTNKRKDAVVVYNSKNFGRPLIAWPKNFGRPLTAWLQENNVIPKNPKLKIKRSCNIIFLLLILGLSSEWTTMIDGDRLLVASIKETTRESGHAHSVIPLPIPDFNRTLDTLRDLRDVHHRALRSKHNIHRQNRAKR